MTTERADLTTSELGLEPNLLKHLDEERERLEEVLLIAEERVAAERAQRDRIVAQIQALEQLVATNLPGETRALDAPRADADAVIDVLLANGRAMHYRDIHAALAEAGFHVGGADPASTLLTRFFNDYRLTRTARGTYWPDEAAFGECALYEMVGGSYDFCGDLFGAALTHVGRPVRCVEMWRVMREIYNEDGRGFRPEFRGRDVKAAFFKLASGSICTFPGEETEEDHSTEDHLSFVANQVLQIDIRRHGDESKFRRVGPVGYATFEVVQ